MPRDGRAWSQRLTAGNLRRRVRNIEIAAEQVQSVGVFPERALVFELHGVTLELRGLRIE